MEMATSLNKVLAPRAELVCRDLELDEPALKWLDAYMTPVAFLNKLISEALYADAVRFLSRALPKREATWWACICARTTLTDESLPALSMAVELAEQWVYKPTEAHRRLTYAAACEATFNQAVAWAAMAAFWSDGSMAPENAPVVAPADNLTGKAAAGAVMLAAVSCQPELAEEKYRNFLKQGIDIANGGNGRI